MSSWFELTFCIIYLIALCFQRPSDSMIPRLPSIESPGFDSLTENVNASDLEFR